MCLSTLSWLNDARIQTVTSVATADTLHHKTGLNHRNREAENSSKLGQERLKSQRRTQKASESWRSPWGAQAWEEGASGSSLPSTYLMPRATPGT